MSEEVMTERLLREVIRGIQILMSEATLDRSELNKRAWRKERFIEFVQSGKLFKVGNQPPYLDEVVTLQIEKLTPSGSKIINPSSNLSSPDDLSAFESWLNDGKDSGFDIKPVWAGSPKGWNSLYKDPTNFQYETAATGRISAKALTPTSLGLGDKEITDFSEIVSAVENKFSDEELSDIREILISLVQATSSSSGRTVSIDPETQEKLKTLDPGDIKKIVKDFGEILSAIAMSISEGYSTIYFPEAVNNPLTDFEIRDSDPKKPSINYSAKGLSGSASSLKNYVEGLKTAKDQMTQSGNSDPEVLQVIDAVVATEGDSLHNSVLTIAQSDALQNSVQVQDVVTTIQTHFGLSSPVDDTAILKAVKDSKDPKALIKSYYDNNLPARPRVDLEKILSVRLSADLVKSLVIYPLMRAVLNEINKENSNFKTAFAIAINTITARQAMMNFDNLKSPTQIIFTSDDFAGVDPQKVKFATKAGATTFKQGGLGVAIKASINAGRKVTMENEKLIREFIREALLTEAFAKTDE